MFGLATAFYSLDRNADIEAGLRDDCFFTGGDDVLQHLGLQCMGDDGTTCLGVINHRSIGTDAQGPYG